MSALILGSAYILMLAVGLISVSFSGLAFSSVIKTCHPKTGMKWEVMAFGISGISSEDRFGDTFIYSSSCLLKNLHQEEF